MGKELVKIENPEIISPLIPARPDDTSIKDALLSKMCLIVCGAAASALFVGGFMVSKLVYDESDAPVYKTNQEVSEPVRGATSEPSKAPETQPATKTEPKETIGNGAFVVGTDVVPGLYRSSGIDTSTSSSFCYAVTKENGVIKENEVSYNVGEPVIIQVAPNTIINVKGCFTFHKIG